MIRSLGALRRHLELGGAIRETRLHDPGSRTIWSVTETDEGVHAAAVKAAQKRKLLSPCADGLFGDAQTYVLARDVDAA